MDAFNETLKALVDGNPLGCVRRTFRADELAQIDGTFWTAMDRKWAYGRQSGYEGAGHTVIVTQTRIVRFMGPDWTPRPAGAPAGYCYQETIHTEFIPSGVPVPGEERPPDAHSNVTQAYVDWVESHQPTAIGRTPRG